MRVLVLNSGSSSLKFAVIDSQSGSESIVGLASNLAGAGRGVLSWRAGDDSDRELLEDNTHAQAFEAVTALLRRRSGLWSEIRGIGHRIVHGGESFTVSCTIDAEVISAIEAVSPLAPLHNPSNLLGVRAAKRAFPELPQVAVFDTAFHQTMPERAFLYPLPRALYEQHRVRRYGFHGTSHRYVVREAARMRGLALEESAIVTAHLGNGCSAAAIRGGRCIDTTMGMTPLEGLVMGTRSGDIDPGLHQVICERLGLDVAGVTALLNEKSGLLGLSGLSNDMRELLAAEAEGHAGARIAIEVFCYRLAKQLAALTVPLGRLDALVFTGGIGEHAAEVRARVVGLLGFLGLQLDEARNRENGHESAGVITAPGHDGAVAMVVGTNEEWMIAQDTAEAIGGSR